MPGVLQQHRDRMENDPAYRKAALSINPDGPGGASLGKYIKTDAPTSLSASAEDRKNLDSTASPASQPGENMVDQTSNTDGSGTDALADLAGDDLENAVRDADIQGRSSMTADEKRDALRTAGWTP